MESSGRTYSYPDHKGARMQPEELSEGKFTNVSEEVVGIKRMKCPRGSDTGKNFPLDELCTLRRKG